MPTPRTLLTLVSLLLATVVEAREADPVASLVRRVLARRADLLAYSRFEVAREQLALGGKNEKLVLVDQLGDKWLFKWINQVRPISVQGELAASALSVATGGGFPQASPITLTINGERVPGSIQRMVPITSTLDGVPPERLSSSQLSQLLAYQVYDWMVGDFDTKGDNKGILADGTVVNLDKSQFSRYIGQDRLDWNYHPNARPGNLPEFNEAIEPYANKVWRAWIAGKIELDTHAMGHAIDRWEQLSEELLRDLLRSFAWTRLAIIDPEGETSSSQFIQLLLERRRTLRADFAAFLERASRARGDRKLTLPPPRSRREVEEEQTRRLREELRLVESAHARLRRDGSVATQDLLAPLDQEARQRVLAFKTSSLSGGDQGFRDTLADLEAMRARRRHPMARAGVGEYIERLRRFGRGEVSRDKLESVLHGRGY